MRIELTKDSEIILTVDENTVKSINKDKKWGDLEFNCPCCGAGLVINKIKL